MANDFYGFLEFFEQMFAIKNCLPRLSLKPVKIGLKEKYDRESSFNGCTK